VPKNPQGIAINPDKGLAKVSAKEHWGSIEANLLLIVDLNTGALLEEMKFEEGILGLAAGNDLGRAVVVSRGEGGLLRGGYQPGYPDGV
jgi:hypothetical protein